MRLLLGFVSLVASALLVAPALGQDESVRTLEQRYAAGRGRRQVLLSAFDPAVDAFR